MADRDIPSRVMLIAPMDATVVVKLRTAGAVILGQTNMPDFADSDTTRTVISVCQRLAFPQKRYRSEIVVKKRP